MEKLQYHNPVLLKESINALNIKHDGVYVDVTFGGGGHSAEILRNLGSKGRLLAFDKDEDAIHNRIDDPRFELIKSDFRYISNFLRLYNVLPVDGILADLGISSHQIDNGNRGFSYRFNSLLDMRMDKSGEKTAGDVLNTYPESQLYEIFRNYGEVFNAGKIAHSIIERRKNHSFITTTDFIDLLKEFSPKGRENQFYSKIFQALRIEVNDELASLEELLSSIPSILKAGGRIAVISYHSLEDRLVKNYFKTGNFSGELQKDFYGNIICPFVTISKKAIVADKVEIENNSRARSARLRIAQKI